jgi:hypothetical protein
MRTGGTHLDGSDLPSQSCSITHSSVIKALMSANENLTLISNRFDLPVILFDRQRCIKHLYTSLPDQSRVRTNARVERIEHLTNGVKVFLADGTVEEADIGASRALFYSASSGSFGALVGLPVCLTVQRSSFHSQKPPTALFPDICS